MASPVADRASAHAAVTAFGEQHDRLFGALDFDGVISLWTETDPEPVYVGDEYAEPVIGIDDLRSHFGRLASRVRAAEMSSDVVEASELADGVLRCVRYTRWSITPREQQTPRTGNSWITWILVTGPHGLRIAQSTETATYEG